MRANVTRHCGIIYWLLPMTFPVAARRLCAGSTESASTRLVQQVLEDITQHWNVSAEVQAQELSRALSSARGLLHGQRDLPRHVAELRAGGTASFLVALLDHYNTIQADEVQSWAAAVSSFLRQHAEQVWGSSSSSQPDTHTPTRRMTRGSIGTSKKSITVPDSVFGLSGRDQAGLTGLPLMRRVLMAQLLLSWMGPWGRQLPDGAQALVASIVEQLYGIHVSSVTRRGMVEFLHISKSGGTSFSDVASENGCTMCDRADGNLQPLDDECRWLNLTALRERTGKRNSGWARYGVVERRTRVHGCAARASFVAGEGYRYISNEYTLHGGTHSMYDTHLCPQFVNVVMLREPTERLESHLRYTLLNWGRAMERNARPGGPQMGQLLCSNWADPRWEAGTWHDLAPAVADNYMTRTFLGEPGFHSPVGSISSDHVSVARALLLQFDLVLDLNAGQQVGDTLLQQGLGWATTLAEVRSRSSEHISEKKGHATDYCVPAGQEEVLGDGKQEPDKELYRFGSALNRLDYLFHQLARQQGLRPAQVAQKVVSNSRAEGGAGLHTLEAEAEEEMSKAAGRCGLVGYDARAPAGPRKARHTRKA